MLYFLSLHYLKDSEVVYRQYSHEIYSRSYLTLKIVELLNRKKMYYFQHFISNNWAI